MKYTTILLIIVSLAMQGCQPVSYAGAATQRVTTPAKPTAASDTKSLRDLPIAVGRGVDGGWFQLYFTDPTDPAAAQISGGPDEPLVGALDGAQLSIDAAIYSLSLDAVRRALIHAHRRGVNVRVVMESDNLDGFDPQALKEAGIQVLGDRREGLMHNKFVIIDRSEVWTGSMNLTDSGTYSDRNNLIRIRSAKLAEDYEAEFNEMFVDDHFGPTTGSPTPNPHVTIDGTVLDVYFSPDDGVQAALLDLLVNAKSRIDFLAYSFTSDPLSEAIRNRAQGGVQVRGVMDEDQMASNTGTEYDRFHVAGLDVRLDQQPGLMHHKVLIIDRQIVVLGSYNFTASAEKYNDENVLVVHSPEIAAEFLQEFKRIYALAGP
jgi:phosphatidylserine/phosphatidylglycerophosphate/cardiolipin synthase-like enzyme